MHEYAAKQNKRPARFDRIIKKLNASPRGTILDRNGAELRRGTGEAMTAEQRSEWNASRSESKTAKARRQAVAKRNAARLAHAKQIIGDMQK